MGAVGELWSYGEERCKGPLVLGLRCGAMPCTICEVFGVFGKGKCLLEGRRGLELVCEYFYVVGDTLR